MKQLALSLAIFSIAVSLTGCGGGSSNQPNTTTNNSTTSTALKTLQPNSSYTMTDAAVLVPAGATVTAPNGTTVTVNGSNSTVYAQVGAVVLVPASANGPASNTVSTGQATTGATATSKAMVSLIAGSATAIGNPVDGTGSSAVFWGGGRLALDPSGNIVVSDRGELRRVTPAGVVQTLWSDSSCLFDGIAVDVGGNIFGSWLSYLSSFSQPLEAASISEFTTSGTIVKLAPNWETSAIDSGMVSGGLAIDKHANLYYADGSNNRIVKFSPDGTMSVLAGNGIKGSTDGVGSAATFDYPRDLAIDANGNLYTTTNVIDSSGYGQVAVRKIAPDGTVTTVGKAPAVAGPIAVDGFGNVYVANSITVTRIDSLGNVTSFPVLQIPNPITALVADSDGNLYAGTRGLGAEILKISFGN